MSASDSAAAINGNSPAASILVVDDEAGIRESLEVLLGFENYVVKTAANGEEGLQLPRSRDLRSRASRSGVARAERPRAAAAIQGAPARSAHHHDHGLRHRRQRGRGHSRGRGKFRPEAVGQRETACRHSLGRGPPPRRGRKPSAQAHPQAALQTSRTSWAKASACCASSTWWRRWRPAGRRF